MACSVHEKNTRASPASMVSLKPSATGRIRKRISIAAPTDVHAQRYAPATLPNIASGTGLPAFFFFHALQVDDHQGDPHPGSDDDQHDAQVVEGAADHRRIEGVEDRGVAQRDRRCRHHGADHHQPEAGPGPAQSDQRLLERQLGDGVAEAHRDQRRKDVAHHRPVRRHRAVVVLRVADPCAERAAHEHLPFAEDDGDRERHEGDPEVGEDEPSSEEHSSPSRRPWPWPGTRRPRSPARAPTSPGGRCRNIRGRA